MYTYVNFFFNLAIKELFLTLQNFWEQTLMALLYFLLKHLKLWMTYFKQRIIVFFFYSHVLTAENLSGEKISQLILQSKFLLLGFLSTIQSSYSISCRGKSGSFLIFFKSAFCFLIFFLSCPETYGHIHFKYWKLNMKWFFLFSSSSLPTPTCLSLLIVTLFLVWSDI